jgi:hypothetical protein
VTAIGLLVSYGAYGLILMQTYQMIRGSATSRPTGAFGPASNRCATFRYDGRRYGGGEEALDRRGDQD